MPVDRFRFVSPGVFINEIDQSQTPQRGAVPPGPAIIGRSAHGPAMLPTTVGSFDEFVQVFGNPLPGGEGGDVWRDGNRAATTYAAYAAQAYLANNGPVTFVRLLGDQSPIASSAQYAKAGWLYPSTAQDTVGGVYGLFITNSGSVASPHVSGTLAALWYLSSSATIELIGPGLTGATAGSIVQGNALMVNTTSLSSGGSTAQEFKVKIKAGGSVQAETTFNFDDTSGRYIRKVFNTNPQMVNPNITTTTNREYYFLGESFERNINDSFNYGTDTLYGVILGLSASCSDFRTSFKLPQTPPIIAQDGGASGSFNINNSERELFVVVAQDEAEWAQNNLKISITDIKDSPNPSFEPFGTFSLQVRAFDDNDNNPVVLEEYSRLNLNPNSPNYIARRIGDMHVSWDAVNKKYNHLGQYENQSRYIRMSMNNDIDMGRGGEDWLPFGFKGVPKYEGFNFRTGSTEWSDLDLNVSSSGAKTVVVEGSGSIMSASWVDPSFPLVNVGGDGTASPGTIHITASFQFPVLPLRVSSSDGGLLDKTNAYWGLQTTKSRTSLVPDNSIKDMLRMRPIAFGRITPTSVCERGPGFSLDNLCWDVSTAQVGYSGSLTRGFVDGTSAAAVKTIGGGRRAGRSMTAISSSYTEPLNRGYDRFTVPMFGGFDGFNISDSEPFTNSTTLGGEAPSTAPEDKDYAMLYTVKKAIDTVADPDMVNINLASVPGMTPRAVTDHLLNMALDRSDTLAVIDLEGGYTPATENSSSFVDRLGSAATTITNIKTRALNNSYGAAYYPWVQMRDTLVGTRVWLPPSVAALGTYGSSARSSELWFAPAGFNRGGLSRGSAGLPTTSVLERLTSKQRDDLYEVNINPIASFPSEGIVVFGQKTLQATPSALDRVNVRRLLIFLKKQISRISTRILFDPNIDVTWNRFLAEVQPLLRSVKSRYGLSEYRVILDETTTTPDLVDRNIMYAKVFLKPTRAIEFIALDFIITRSGASFDD
jgi:hypothetical protein